MTVILDVERRYAATPHHRTHNPGKLSRYDKYRACLRLEFSFRCVYCLATEPEVARGAKWGDFEIEHFMPKAKFRARRNDYTNLYWTCQACNRAKQETWPTRKELARGFRFIEPTREAIGQHLSVDVDTVVVAVGGDANAAQYMIDEINLNSPLHKKRRRDRKELTKRFTMLSTQVDLMERAANTPDTLERLRIMREQLRQLEHLVKPDACPWDAPIACACPASSG